MTRVVVLAVAIVVYLQETIALRRIRLAQLSLRELWLSLHCVALLLRIVKVQLQMLERAQRRANIRPLVDYVCDGMPVERCAPMNDGKHIEVELEGSRDDVRRRMRSVASHLRELQPFTEMISLEELLQFTAAAGPFLEALKGHIDREIKRIGGEPSSRVN